MKDGQLILRNGILYQWRENLPCSECCFMVSAVDGCVAGYNIPFCGDGGWLLKSQPAVRTGLRNDTEQRRDKLHQQNPTGE